MKISKLKKEEFLLFYIDPIHDFVFRKWKFEGIISHDNLKLFLEGVWQGHIEPYFVSEEPPLKNGQPLKVIPEIKEIDSSCF